ncbi:hypothetical protein L6471_02055 [Segatella bryantii]|uniref:hypothetical protein n=1 Tax=Segatella bryantii TaxID=77095 RepID=UPI001EDC8A25|nr:hypothetical protein [Segatella bryantii]UKK75272.1 hypothetical protein L6471_02055 [Segatella bryantii]
MTLRDTVEKDEADNIVIVAFNRFSFISSKIDSVRATKIQKILKKLEIGLIANYRNNGILGQL